MNRIDRVFLSERQAKKPAMVWQTGVDAAEKCGLLAEKMRNIREEKGTDGTEIWELYGTGEGVEAEDLLKLVKRLREEYDPKIPVALRLPFHQIFRYGLEAFTDGCIEAGVDGVRVLDLPMEEQPQLKVYLLKEGAPYLLQQICPQSGDRILEVTKYAKGYVYCTADPSFWDEQIEYGSMLHFFLYAAETVCPAPLILDFKHTDVEQLKPYLEIAAGMAVPV